MCNQSSFDLYFPLNDPVCYITSYSYGNLLLVINLIIYFVNHPIFYFLEFCFCYFKKFSSNIYSLRFCQFKASKLTQFIVSWTEEEDWQLFLQFSFLKYLFIQVNVSFLNLMIYKWDRVGAWFEFWLNVKRFQLQKK